MSIADSLLKIKNTLPASVTLVAVSKTKPVSDILEAYQAGQKHFGENKVQELVDKQAQLPADIQWHLIGHLQSNKVKYIAPFVSLIHSVDSYSLLLEINKQGAKNNRIIPVLLQFHIATEESKFGFSISEVIDMMQSSDFKDLKNIQINGVMGMATFTENTALIQQEFRDLKNIFTQLKSKYFPIDNNFKEISMGMSGDYELAISEGSTLIRVGSSIFGGRKL
jgi:pyridoxal phosphate enzyme (YggS family)